MLVVISSPTAVANEASIINSLFDEGLEVLHLRKPDIAMDEMRSLLQKIRPQYYQRVSLHQHHETASDFGIRRLHYTELNMKKTKVEELIKLKRNKNCLSTSIHQIEEYRILPDCFEYTFFGPVFDSISKAGYASQLTDDFIFPIAEKHSRVIAIGGIDATNIQKAMKMNFDGVAALGTIWKKPEESITQFKILQKAWKETGR